MTTPQRTVLTAAVLLGAVLAGLFWSRTGHSAAAASPSSATSPSAGPSALPASAGVLQFKPDAPQLSSLKTQAVTATAMPLSADPLSARVTYDEDATARLSAPVAGRIVRLAAAPGQAVRAGQVLAEIDAPDLGAALADLAKATSDEARKRSALERAQALGSGEGIAAKEIEAARADAEQARAETLRAQQRVANLNPAGARITGQRLSVTSPVAGVVTERSATPSLEVAPGMATPLFVVTDPHRLWLMIDLPDALVGQAQLGQAVAVESDAYPGQRFVARVAQLGQLVDPNSRRVTLRATLPNPQGRLLPEMFVRAWLQQSAGQAVRVPMSAVVDRGVRAYVFVEQAPGRFERREVKLASRGSDVGYVTQGLRGGENVVTAGALLLDGEMADRGAAAAAAAAGHTAKTADAQGGTP
jgi:cobalt-zinc-cadmium efflux system membrane fusion protein